MSGYAPVTMMLKRKITTRKTKSKLNVEFGGFWNKICYVRTADMKNRQQE